MAKEASTRRLKEQCTELRVVHDFAPDYPITAAELDAIEAYLGPLLNDLLVPKQAGNRPAAPGFDSELPQRSAR